MGRQFMNNTDDLLTFEWLGQENNQMVMSAREICVAYLDPQLCLQNEVMPVKEWKNSQKAFCK